MVGILFIGGAGPTESQARSLLKQGTKFVAADSGLELALALGIIPDLLVGDMDSISDPTLIESIPPEKRLVFPQDKDETDTEIGLRILHEMGANRIIMLGGGEGRFDHFLGLYKLFEGDVFPRIWMTGREYIELVDSETTIPSHPGQIFSFFPIDDSVAGLWSRGLRWSLDGIVWQKGQASISNEAVAETISVGVTQGLILAVKQLDS